MIKLRVCYPQRVADEEHFAASVHAYHELLDRFTDEQILKAFAAAPVGYLEFFPSAGQLIVLAEGKKAGYQPTHGGGHHRYATIAELDAVGEAMVREGAKRAEEEAMRETQEAEDA